MSVRDDIEDLPAVVDLLDRIANADPTDIAEAMAEIELTRALIHIGSASIRTKRARVRIGEALDIVDRHRTERVS
jgi:hypothetical protein